MESMGGVYRGRQRGEFIESYRTINYKLLTNHKQRGSDVAKVISPFPGVHRYI